MKGAASSDAIPRSTTERGRATPSACTRYFANAAGSVLRHAFSRSGPGTGQVSRRLLELGVDSLVAVEPDPALASFLRSSVGDGPEILVTTLEEAVLPADAFDLAVAASSFHWVEPERGLAAIFRALRAGGWWAMWWTHHGDRTRPDPFRDAIDPIVGGLPSSPGATGFGRDADAATGALAKAGFEDSQVDVVR